jgi:nitronate monooxygenase
VSLFKKLKYPIMQAPIGSACSLELTSAVSNAGALGSIALTWHSPEQTRTTARYLLEKCNGPFAVNFACSFDCPGIEAAVEEGVPIITLSWGMPTDKIRQIKRSKSILGIQIGSAEGARMALDAGADFLICQGVEAGGHVQSSTPLLSLLEAVLNMDNSIPVIATGGIANAKDVTEALNAGATMAALGTRFVNASESNAHASYQQAISNAVEDDAVLTPCFDGDWPYSSVRVLRNRTLMDWEAHGCPPVGRRPGEGDIVATTSAGWNIPRYHIASPVNTTTGEVLDLALYAGTSSARINDVLPAQEIIEQLCIKDAPNVTRIFN